MNHILIKVLYLFKILEIVVYNIYLIDKEYNNIFLKVTFTIKNEEQLIETKQHIEKVDEYLK